ncbi:proline racemase family protein [Cytobacillus massiliigabonensis]|uniref:proline racemase family protein n=1 Tax=Cytobacillus massiliigabonensis TaxID=1871011 RepID=UPI000C83D0D5|nr:proline racemase family protein [Cytobacillus massiliigabonensis]
MKIQKAYTATDVHVAGEAFRIIREAPFIYYQSLQQLEEQFPHEYADVIKFLLNEPRGFAGLNGCLVIPPFSREADAAVVFFTHEGTMPLSYGGAVAVITALLECGQLPPNKSNEYKLETADGIIPLKAVVENNEVVSVELKSEPCQIVQMNIPYKDTHYSLVQADQLYAVFKKSDVPFQLQMEDLPKVQKWGQEVNKALDVKSSIKGAILLDDSLLESGKIKTVTFRRDNFIVRSPGFGSAAACYASLLASGEFSMDQPFRNESIFNSSITIQLAYQSGGSFQFSFNSRGFITGIQTYVLDPTDPLAAGFLLK